jgi:hypothetical protein
MTTLPLPSSALTRRRAVEAELIIVWQHGGTCRYQRVSDLDHWNVGGVHFYGGHHFSGYRPVEHDESASLRSRRQSSFARRVVRRGRHSADVDRHFWPQSRCRSNRGERVGRILGKDRNRFGARAMRQSNTVIANAIRTGIGRFMVSLPWYGIVVAYHAGACMGMGDAIRHKMR